MASQAHPWVSQPLKGEAQHSRHVFRKQLAAGWTAVRRCNGEYPDHRQFRVTTDATAGFFVDLFRHTCSCGQYAAPCDHSTFVQNLGVREGAIPEAEWEDPLAALQRRPTWQQKMAAFHHNLAASRATRETEERERLHREKERRAKFASEQEAFFHPQASRPDNRSTYDDDVHDDDDDNNNNDNNNPDAKPHPRAKRQQHETPPPGSYKTPFADTHSARSESSSRPAPAADSPEALNAVLQTAIDAWRQLDAQLAVHERQLPALSATHAALLRTHRRRVSGKLLKTLRVLWHPDRFSQRFRAKFASGPAFDAALACVTREAQLFNTLV
jgi:hypothetical protein